MQGFGAAQAYNESWVVAHPNKEMIYQLIFGDLELDWLRVQSVYGHGVGTDNASALAEFVQKAHQYSPDSVRLYKDSWSPTVSIKSNDSLSDGTLIKDTTGNYVYGAFGDYWKAVLQHYDSAGVTPDWISIQNEPNFSTTGWATYECLQTFL